MIQSIPLGARYMALSALSFSIMALFVKAAGSAGIPVLEIVAFRALISLAISYVAIKRKGIPLLGNNKALLFSRGFVGFTALICVFYGLINLPLAEATVIQYLHPVFTAILAILFLKERPSLTTYFCVLFSLIGLVIIVRPNFMFGTMAGSFSPLAVTAAMLGAFGSACAYILVKRLSTTEDPLVIVFYFPLVTLPGTLPFMWHQFVMPEGIIWVYLLGVGLATQVGQIALTKGMQTESASRATSFSYLQILFAIILGFVFYDEVPDAWTLLGAGIIFASALFNVASSSRS